MSGTVIGGKKAGIVNKQKYGDDFYKKIGQKGGKKSRNGGFASNKVGLDGLTGAERARLAGRKGGLRSKRGKNKKLEENK